MSGKKNRAVEVKKLSDDNLLVDHMIIGLSGMQGIRESMEDQHFKRVMEVQRNGIKTITLLGVFDGHGGVETAKFLKNNLYPMIIGVLEKQIQEIKYPRDRILEYDEDIENIFQACDYKCCKTLFQEGFEDTSGSTCIATISTVYEDDVIEVVTCNTGDSRCVLYDRGNVVALSVDHKPTDKEESDRVEKNKGFISRDRIHFKRNDMKFTLGVSRAFGDFSAKPITEKHCNGRKPKDTRKAMDEVNNQLVIVKPRVTRYIMRMNDVGGIDPYRFIVQACDGIFDVMSSDKVCDFVLMRLKEQEDKSYAENRMKRLSKMYRSSRLPLDLISKTGRKVEDKTSATKRKKKRKKKEDLSELKRYDVSLIAEELLDFCVLEEGSSDNCSAAIILFKGEKDWV